MWKKVLDRIMPTLLMFYDPLIEFLFSIPAANFIVFANGLTRNINNKAVTT